MKEELPFKFIITRLLKTFFRTPLYGMVYSVIWRFIYTTVIIPWLYPYTSIYFLFSFKCLSRIKYNLKIYTTSIVKISYLFTTKESVTRTFLTGLNRSLGKMCNYFEST